MNRNFEIYEALNMDKNNSLIGKVLKYRNTSFLEISIEISKCTKICINMDKNNCLIGKVEVSKIFWKL